MSARVVVLDDDPTGTQTVSDLPVVLTPDVATLSALAQSWDGPVWVLTNTRAMPWTDASPFLERVVASVRAVFGPSARLVLRGDSTLRGHVLDEIDALSGPDSVALFVPAFLEQGRVTVDGTHWVTVDGQRVEAARTEYARDPEFGYRSSDLVDWIDEREPGRRGVGLPLAQLRAGGADALRDLLLALPAGAVAVPDAESLTDLETIGAAWTAAEASGRSVVLRCAASLASVVTGSQVKPVRLEPVDGGVLVVCASYTSGASAQLAQLQALGGVTTVEVDIDRALTHHPYPRMLAGDVSASLRTGAVTVLSTPRVPAVHALSLDAGAKLMDAVIEAVRRVRGEFAALVTKGGITSARVARDAMQVPIAHVRGQVLPGVPVWALGFPAATARIDQVVVPGNVGMESTLREVVSQLLD